MLPTGDGMLLTPSNQVIGRYEIVSLLGQGTYSEVYLANDTALRRKIALKVLKEFDSFAGIDTADKLHEARILAKLSHPNIVTVFDTFQAEGKIFIAMEHLDGGTVASYNAVPGHQRLESIFQQIAEAIAHAHEIGILHGDIKPSNIAFAHDGTPKVIDFGLAKLTGQAALLSTLPQGAEMGSSVIGTLPFMAPELARGEEPGPLSDIFALGAVFYQLVFGRPAFSGSNEAAILNAVLSGKLPAFETPGNDAEKPVVALIQQMLAGDKNKRPTSMSAVAEELAAVSLGPTRQAPLPRSLDLRRPINQTSFWKAAAVAILAGGMALGYAGGSENTGMRQARTLMGSLEAGYSHLKRFGSKGELAAAQAEFENILLYDPENAAATAGLALTFLRRYTAENRDPALFNRAKETANVALSLDKNLAVTQLVMGRVLKQDGKYQEARPFLERAIVLDPTSYEASLELAFIDHRIGSTKQAIERLKPLYRQFPEVAAITRALARLYYADGDYKNAELAFTHQIALSPDDSRAYSNLSAVQHLQGDTLAAISTLQQGLKIRPSRTLYSNLGTYLFFLRQYPQAVSAFEDALNVQGGTNDYRIWANLADAYSMVNGKQERAQQAYLRATQLLMKQFPAWRDDKILVSKVGLYQAKSGEFAEADSNINRVMNHGPVAPDILFRAAVVKEIIGKRQEALSLVEAALINGYPATEIENAPELFVLRQSPEFHILQTRITTKSNT